MPDDPSAVIPSKPRLSAALVLSVLAGLALLFILVETAISAVSGIVDYGTPAWHYWPWVVGIEQVLFALFPLVCLALSFFGAKRRGTVFLLLALAWLSAALVNNIWRAGLASFLKAYLPMLLSVVFMLVLLVRARKPAFPAPLTVVGIFAAAFVSYASLKTIFYYAFNPLWGPEGFIPIFWNIVALVLLAPFYIRRAGAVKRFNIVFLSLALIYHAFFCGVDDYSTILYYAMDTQERMGLLGILSTVAIDACIIASMAIALVLAVKAYRANKKGALICNEEDEEQEEQIELNIEEDES